MKLGMAITNCNGDVNLLEAATADEEEEEEAEAEFLLGEIYIMNV